MNRFPLMLSGLLVMVAVLLISAPQSDVDVSASETVTAAEAVAAAVVGQSEKPAAEIKQHHRLKPALQRVATEYRRQNQWPEYSLPLSDSQSELIYPNQGAAIQHSLAPLGLEGELRIDMQHYRYRLGDDISVQVSLFGDDNLLNQTSQLQLYVTDRKKKNIQSLTAIQLEHPASKQWQAEFEALKSWPEELLVNAELTLVDGQQLSYSAPFEIFDAVAEIKSVEPHYVSGNELIIPVKVVEAEAGYYKLAATLFTSRNQPIAFLQGKNKLSSRGIIELKVHGSLLANLNTRQDLVLKSLQLRRIPAKPGDEQIGWGISREPSFVIHDVDPAQFDDHPFQSAQLNARAEFLEALGQ